MTSELTQIKILIVEDNPIIAEDLRSLLEMHDYTVIAVAYDFQTATDALHNQSIDFAILDIHLGTGPSGLDVAEIIHDKHEIPYIFLSSFDDEKTLNDAQEHGPYGYLVKPFQDRSLMTTIKVALANFNKSKQSQFLNKEKILNTALSKVTDQEFKIIEQLANGLSYKQISEVNFTSINTVKFHTKNIYSKLNISGRASLVQFLS